MNYIKRNIQAYGLRMKLWDFKEEKMNFSERKTVESAKNLSKYIETLGLSAEQAGKLNYLILKHVDDCIHWGIQVKLANMLEDMEDE